jgi:ABC-type transport system involved in cytochrome c biogenesis permease subunit
MVAFSIPFNSGTKGYLAFPRGISFAAMVFTASGILWQPHNAPLPPVLKTLWFELHVVLAFFSYALFGIGAAIGVFSLRQKDVFREALQYRAILIGYCLFSLSMILGGIWAYLAWGTYWLWTPKELWTSIVWLFYTFYLHARLMQGWAGRPLASLGIFGFFVVMFTYLGVSLFMKSSHTF